MKNFLKISDDNVRIFYIARFHIIAITCSIDLSSVSLIIDKDLFFDRDIEIFQSVLL